MNYGKANPHPQSKGTSNLPQRRKEHLIRRNASSSYEHAGKRDGHRGTQNGYGITQTWTQNGAVSTFDSDDPTWSIVTAALSTRYAALIRDDNGDGALAAADLPIAYILLDDTPTDHTVQPGNDLILGINALGYFQIGDA